MVRSATIGRMPSAGALLCLASAAAFGAMGIFGKLAYDEGATRRHAAGRPLRARGRAVLAASWPAHGRRPRPARAAAARRRLALALGAVGYSAQAGGYFAALERLDASLLSLLVYTFPAIVAVAAIALGRERASRRTAVALALASAGLVARPGGRRRGRAGPARHGARARRPRSSTAPTSSPRRASPRASARSPSARWSAPARRRPSRSAALAGGDLDPGARERGGLRLAGGHRGRLDGRRRRPVLRRAAARRPDGRVDPLDARAGGHRRRWRSSSSASRSAPCSSPAARSCSLAVLAVRAPAASSRRRPPSRRLGWPP